MERKKHKKIAILVVTIYIGLIMAQAQAANNSPQETQPISSRLAFLRAQRAAAASRLSQSLQQQQQQQQQPSKNSTAKANTETTTRGTATSIGSLETVKPATGQSQQSVAPPKATATNNNQLQQSSASNRTTRTADIFQGGEGFNIFVTNTCERELMHVNIKTSRPFFGVIHTRALRQRPACTVEGNGETEYNLDINHVLNPQDPLYCGVIKARRESPEDKELLSVVLAVRVHRNIELSDDKFFLLNCTNRCRRPDCSMPPLARLTDGGDTTNARNIDDPEREAGERETGSASDATRQPNSGNKKEEDECTIWKFPWIITLLWCMGILLLAMIISHCIMCSSLVCRCVRTEVEEREPSVYEGATDLDDEDSLYNRKTHPMRIDYDNRDIYKTSNNYEPYAINDENCDDDNQRRNEKANKRRNRSRR